MRRLEVLTLLCVATFCFLSLPNYNTTTSTKFVVRDVDPRVEGQFNEWKQCIETNIFAYRHDAKGLWSNLRQTVKSCEALPFMRELKIKDFRNSDEVKRHIVSMEQTPSIIVTLGIGHDTRAEEALRKMLPDGSLFYGADPMHEINEELFNKIGTFLPLAVGSRSEISRASVLINGSYKIRSVIHIDLAYFLTNIIGHTVYDALWIDAEWAEYDLFPHFYREGKLDHNGITVCQFNMEIHNPNDAQKELFRKFIFRLLEDNRYAFFRPVQGRHMRLYFLNFSDRHCVSKYVLGTNEG